MRSLIYAHAVAGRRAWTHGQTRFYRTIESMRPLLTLNPEKIAFSGQVPHNLSKLTRVAYSIPVRDCYLPANIRYVTQQRLYIPFPENTRGFLYYKGPRPGDPDIAGSLRFRIVSGPDSAYSFENGADLKLPTGGIWQIHMYAVVRTDRHTGILMKLLEEGLVSSLVVQKLRDMPYTLLRGTGQVLCKLEDPFVARLHSVDSLVYMSQEDIQAGQIMPMFFDPRINYKIHPYEGFVLARFERSTLEEHANTRTILLRILQELSPIRCVLQHYDGYIAMPTAGQLLSGIYHKGGRYYRPWSANLDKMKGKASRMISLLWPPRPNGMGKI